MDQTTPPSSPVPSITSFEEAKAFLDTCTREELRDHAFGDMEIGWYLNGQEVASGYFGSTQSISIFAAPDQPTMWSCDGREASELRRAGKLGKVERNDSTGPDTYQEGEVMPGLTLEGVRKELETRKE